MKMETERSQIKERLGPLAAEKGKEGLSPAEGLWLCRHLDFELLTSRTVQEYISAVLKPPGLWQSQKFVQVPMQRKRKAGVCGCFTSVKVWLPAGKKVHIKEAQELKRPPWTCQPGGCHAEERQALSRRQSREQIGGCILSHCLLD